MYKAGDYYPNWQKLTPLPLKPAKDHEPPLQVGELFVVVESGATEFQLPTGTIVQLIHDDTTTTPLFTGTSNTGNYYKISQMARLPVEPEKPTRKKSRIWTRYFTETNGVVTVQKVVSDDGIVVEKESIDPEGSSIFITTEEARELHAKLSAALKKHKKIYG